jgi:RNA polymerase sigma factor (sigma-70 family)
VNDSPGLHELIKGVAGKDELSKQELFSVTEQPLIRHITKHFGSIFTQDDIREIYNQAYMQILIKAQSYRGDHGDASAWQWAYKIARSQAHKWLRACKRLVDVSVDTDNMCTLTEEERLTLFARRTDPEWIGRTIYEIEDQAFERILVDQMRECYELLTPRERLVVHLYHFMDMTLEEIAHQLGVTRTRIHQVLHGAYKKCRALMVWEQTLDI